MEINREGWRVFFPVYEQCDEDVIIDTRPFQDLDQIVYGMYCVGIQGDKDCWVYESVEKTELRECVHLSKTIF